MRGCSVVRLFDSYPQRSWFKAQFPHSSSRLDEQDALTPTCSHLIVQIPLLIVQTASIQCFRRHLLRVYCNVAWGFLYIYIYILIYYKSIFIFIIYLYIYIQFINIFIYIFGWHSICVCDQMGAVCVSYAHKYCHDN